MVRDCDVVQNVLQTLSSSSSGTPGFLTEEETRAKVARLQDVVLARARKRRGRVGGGGLLNEGEREEGGGEEGEEGGEGGTGEEGEEGGEGVAGEEGEEGGAGGEREDYKSEAGMKERRE